jgi:long-chain acyl-CoA synthetase
MDKHIWLKSYPRGVPSEIDPGRYESIVDVVERSCAKFGRRPCFTNRGVTLSFDDVWDLSGRFAAFLENDLGLIQGDRIGLQMPNILQYPVAMFGALRAGLTVVNTNPLYTPRELEHQYRDAGVKAIVVLANFARNLQTVWPALGRPPVVLTQLGDLFPTVRRLGINFAVRHLKKLVPHFDLPGAVPFRTALSRGRGHGPPAGAAVRSDDVAFLQYTGGTTGIAKGAMLTHRNVIANMEQASAWMGSRFAEGEEIVVTPLPLYHIFSLTVNCLLFLKWGGRNVLVENPRDFRSFVDVLRARPFTVLTAVSTMLDALMNQPDFAAIDFSRAKLTVAGAMPLSRAVAERWRARTKSVLIEGYGLTEASPIVCANPVDGTDRLGTIGLPFPSTDVRLVDDAGVEVPLGNRGELTVRGPQVMKGYWNRTEETATALRDGWLWTGDVAEMDPDGFLRIVDRIKDMILVSGFNVYPSEVEDVLMNHPDVVEVGAVGVPNERSGEAVKVVIVSRRPTLAASEVVEFCRTRLAAYKVPKLVEFRSELPKTNLGKVLRRALR